MKIVTEHAAVTVEPSGDKKHIRLSITRDTDRPRDARVVVLDATEQSAVCAAIKEAGR